MKRLTPTIRPNRSTGEGQMPNTEIPKEMFEPVNRFAAKEAKENYPYTIGHEPYKLSSPRENDNWASMTTFCCETCANYIGYRCRRHSPAGQEGWPAVYPTDWCGDHKIAKLRMALLQAGGRAY